MNYKGKKKEEKKKKRSNKNLPFILFGNKDIITLDLDECTGNEIEIDVVFGKGRNSDFCNNDVDTEVYILKSCSSLNKILIKCCYLIKY